MSTIVTRATKGSALTWTEGDANITNLNNDKIEDIVEDTSPQLGGNLDVNGNKIVSASNGNIALEPNGTGKITATSNIETSGDVKAFQLFSTQSSGDEGGEIKLAKPATGTTIGGTGVNIDVYQNKLRIWEDGGTNRGAYIDLTAAGASVGSNLLAGSGGGLANVVEDLSPQLGGDLDVNGKNITSASNGSINITPNGSGNISLAPASGKIILGACDWPSSTGTTGQVLTSGGGSGVLSWTTVSGGSSDLVSDTSPQLGGNLDVNGKTLVNTIANPTSIDITTKDIILTTGNTGIGSNGKVILSGLSFPNADGTNTQVLATDGAGQLYWTTSGGSTLDSLTDVVLGTPATGEVLYYNGTNWVDTPASGLTVGTATNADNINIATTTGNANDTTMSVVLVPLQATGNQAPHIDTGIYYNASTNILTASQFAGGLNGAVGSTTPSTGAFTRVTLAGATNLGKLILDTTALSSTAWTTAGIGLKVQNATYTDTGSSGTIAASHVHAIAAPTLASTSATTVTDAATLYLSGAPTASTNTTITNGWALLSGGKIKATDFTGTIGATTRSTGAFTTLTADTTTLDDIRETVAALTYGATITPDAANGSVQTVTLTGNVTFSAFANPVSGQTITLIITQDATGSRTLTSTMKFAGGLKTLSTAANSIDILTVSYIGTTYYASLAKGFA